MKRPSLHFRELGVIGVLALEITLFALLSKRLSGSGDWLFLERGNLLAIVVDAAVIGISTVGMALVIIAGGIDLSVGGVIALAAVLAARLLVAHWPLAAVIPLVLAAGLVAGAANAILVTLVELPPFIATLALMLIARGTAFVISKNQYWTIENSGFVDRFGNGTWLGVPYPALVLIAVAALFSILLARTAWGRQVFAVGGNETASRYAGVHVARIKWSVYLLSGCLSALAGLVYAAKYGSGQSSVAGGYELDAVAAAVVGGASLSGGRGSVVGAALGALIFAALRKGLSFIGGAADYEGVIVGVVVIMTVVLDRLIQHSSRRGALS